MEGATIASIVLGVVGAAVGGALGNPLLGWNVGVAVGGIVDAARNSRRQDVGRLSDVPFAGSTYGAMIPQVWGRYGRLAGNVIWGGDLVESHKDSGSFLTGGSTRTFSYSATFAVMWCRGPASVRRIWAGDILIFDNSLGLGAASETQSISIGSNTSGHYSISFGGSTTANIFYNDSAATIQGLLEALPSIGSGNITVTGTGPWTAAFTGTLAGQNVARMDMNDGTLSGGSGQGIHTQQQGGIKYNITNHDGAADQAQDPTMVGVLGSANCPAYRGRCYSVFNAFPLALWGNSISNLNLMAEVENFGSLAALVTDTFTRADGNIGIAESGQTWQQAGTNAQITSNKCRSTAGTQAYIDCGLADCTIQLTMANRDPVNGSTRIVARFSTTNDYLYFGESAASSTYVLSRKQSGLFNTLLDTGITPANGDQLKLVLSGSTLQGYRNGSLIATATETFQQTSTQHGFGSPEDFSTCDDFTITPNAVNSISLAEILADVFQQEGLQPSEYDVTAATDKVDGYGLLNRAAVRDMSDLLAYYNTLLIEVDGRVKAVKRGGAPVLTILEDDLAARIHQGEETDVPPKVEVKRADPLSLPFRLDVGYLSGLKNYEQTSQGATRYTKTFLQEAITLNTGLALRDNGVITAETQCRQVAERLLYDAWTGQTTYSFSLGPKYLQLCPGDVILLPHAGNVFRVRITQMDLALPGPLSIQAVLDDAATLVQEAEGGVVIGAGVDPVEVTQTTLVAWAGTALVNADADTIGIYLAATGNGTGFWSGASIYWSRDSGASFQPLTTITTPATVGTVTSVLAAGLTTGLFDDVNTVDVLVPAGTAPVSTSDADLYSGANAYLVGDEALQAGVVTALGGGSYRLSHLLRGRRGSDGRWGEHVTGERFVVLSPGLVTRAVLGAALYRQKVIVKAVSNGEAIDDADEQTLLVLGEEARCYAPANVAGTRNIGLDLTATWTRRSRQASGVIGGADEPLAELTEAYVLAIRSGVLKTITGITQATSAVITSTSHGFAISDVLRVTGLYGMTPLNGTLVTVTAVTTDTISINVDSTPFAPWLSGGSLEKVVRQISTSTPTGLYTSAQQVADFGSAQSSIAVAVFMVGLYGNGAPTMATL